MLLLLSALYPSTNPYTSAKRPPLIRCPKTMDRMLRKAQSCERFCTKLGLDLAKCSMWDPRWMPYAACISIPSTGRIYPEHANQPVLEPLREVAGLDENKKRLTPAAKGMHSAPRRYYSARSTPCSITGKCTTETRSCSAQGVWNPLNRPLTRTVETQTGPTSGPERELPPGDPATPEQHLKSHMRRHLKICQ